MEQWQIDDASRLKALFESRKRYSQAEFGAQFGIGNQGYVWQLLNGRRPLNIQTAKAFSEGLGVSIEAFSPTLASQITAAIEYVDRDEIAEGQALLVPAASRGPADGYVRLAHLSPEPSMGQGREVVESEHIVEYLDVLERWVREKVGSTNPSRIKILTSRGNSMRPTILDEDLVFVDTACRTIEVEGIYVLDVVGRLLLKRVLILSDGTLIIRSDNTDEYPNEERHDLRRAAETIIVCGKVLAWWTLKKG